MSVTQLTKPASEFFAIFSWQKTFRRNRFLGSYWLNFIGLHVIRLVFAHALFRLRLLILSPLVDRTSRKSFIQDGIIRVNSVLQPDLYQALKNELTHFQADKRIFAEGSTRVERIYLPPAVRDQMSALSKVWRMPVFARLFRWASSKNRMPFAYIENLTNHQPGLAAPDPQRDIHADTFHPCIKGWLYFDHTDQTNGPFMYAKGSHRLTWKRLVWEWRQSLLSSRARRQKIAGRYWDGSFRIQPGELGALGFHMEPIHVDENTLVIANVHGFHCRGPATQPSQRMTLWLQSRDNPFNPLPALHSGWADALASWYWTRQLHRRDATEMRAGKLQMVHGCMDRYPASQAAQGKPA